MKSILSIILLVTLILLSIASYAFSQGKPIITIQPIWEFKSPAKFKYIYQLETEGESTIGDGIFTYYFTIEKVHEDSHSITFRTIADTVLCSNPVFTEGSEEGFLYAMMGINMDVEVDRNGKFIRLINEQEVLAEFKSGLIGYTPASKEEIFDEMTERDKELLFPKLFELNYALLMDHLNRSFEIPSEIIKDTVIQATHDTPKETSRIIEKKMQVNDQIEIRTEVKKALDMLIQQEGPVEYTLFPVNHEGLTTMTFNKNGMLLKIISDGIEKTGGFKVSINGKESNSSITKMIIKIKISLELID